MIIRGEHPGEQDAIRELTAAAFAPMPYSDGSESVIIDNLRMHGDLTHSLVAVLDGVIIGQITFSPVTIGGVHNRWFGLGPVSVDPARQKQGIGSALINKGLDILKGDGAKGCVLVGDPDYYSRFGFKSDPDLNYGELDNRYVQMITLRGSPRHGELKYSRAFEEAASG